MTHEEIALNLMLKILDRAVPEYASPELTGKTGDKSPYYDPEKVAASYRKMLDIISPA